MDGWMGAGRQFLDFCAGIAVSGLGHSDADWYKALVDAGKVRCDLPTNALL